MERGQSGKAVRRAVLSRNRRAHVRRVARWETIPHDQGGRRIGAGARAAERHRRPALGRGSEAPRADKMTGIRSTVPLQNVEPIERALAPVKRDDGGNAHAGERSMLALGKLLFLAPP